jgi:phenylpyruvate tautomerase PptA (4-oxalocrotonate tautomerase family)
MPILDVEIVTRPGEVLRPTLARELADAAGAALDSRPSGTWVRLRTLQADHYAEGPGTAPLAFPVFVEVLKADIPIAAALQDEVSRLTAVVAQLCDRPTENVHIVYLPRGRGRVSFGGRLLTD